MTNPISATSFTGSAAMLSDRLANVHWAALSHTLHTNNGTAAHDH
jgi:hypothetical protein